MDEYLNCDWDEIAKCDHMKYHMDFGFVFLSYYISWSPSIWGLYIIVSYALFS